MRISDWSSDVCSSDLHSRSTRASSTTPPLGAAGAAASNRRYSANAAPSSCCPLNLTPSGSYIHGPESNTLSGASGTTAATAVVPQLMQESVPPVTCPSVVQKSSFAPPAESISPSSSTAPVPSQARQVVVGASSIPVP